MPGPGRPDGEIGSFWYHFRPDQALAAQTVELVNLVPFSTRSGPGYPDGEIGAFWYHFRPDRALAAQMVKLVHFGTIF